MAREKRDAVTSIRLYPSMKARIDEQASKSGVKFSEWVEEALERSLRSAEDRYTPRMTLLTSITWKG